MNKEARELIERNFKGLTFQSETDAPFIVTHDKSFREIKWSDFKRRLIAQAGDDKELVKRFKYALGNVEANIKRRRVYLKGKVEIDILIVGTDLSGNAFLMSTKAVET